MIVHEAEPFNAESPTEVLAADLVTPVEAFYSRNHGPIPQITSDGWQLKVDGMVDTPATFLLHDLQDRFEHVTLTATMQCAGNRRAVLNAVREIPGEDLWGPGATSTARWTGARLRDVLAACAPQQAAGYVAFEAPDVSQLADPPQRYGGSITLDKAMSAEVLLAWGMNDRPLVAAHGAPVRVVVPGYIGARSVKWVERISVQAGPSENYFQATAYRMLPAEADPSTAGPGDGISLNAVALNCAILSPLDGCRVGAGNTRVCGYALAGDGRTVMRVDVSIDGGDTWIQADLEHTPGPWAWSLWQVDIDFSAGEAGVVARAWDSTGATHPESARHLWNPKGYANNSWARINFRVA